jgi:K(+)-stimulated pyrophosphate-energized sodium pump
MGLVVCVIGAMFGVVQYHQTKNLPVHSSMRAVSNTIWETCKTYLLQQGKFLVILWVLIAVCIAYYFMGLQQNTLGHVLLILASSVLGILGSYGVLVGIRSIPRPIQGRPLRRCAETRSRC